MSQHGPQALARILAAPWHQRRNAGGRWGMALVLALCFAAPVVLYTWSFVSGSRQQAAMLRISAGGSLWVGVGALLAVGWAMVVGNILQQNHPTQARLVPHHPGQLRLALLVAWALASLAAAALPGFAFDAALAWGCGTAAALVALAAAMRWPLLWLVGIAAPFVVGGLTRMVGAFEFEDALRSGWIDHHLLATCLVATAGTSVLVLTIRNGGSKHMASYEARQRLRQTVLAQHGALPVASGRWGWISGLAVDGRPYAWWMARVLARPRSPVMSRLLLGLGPACHWTTRIFQGLWFVIVSVVACACVSLFIGNDMFAYVLPWLAFSVLTGVASPALQAVPQLRQTQREQALLTLLPGVPRGARLNRWLAWQMTVSFLVASVCSLLVAWGLDAFADALRPGIAVKATGGMTFGVAAVLLPQVAWQWRHWARLPYSTGGIAQVPTVAAVVLGIGVMVLHAATGLGYVAVGVGFAVAALVYCVWRWSRMGAEPSAFPVGRLT